MAAVHEATRSGRDFRQRVRKGEVLIARIGWRVWEALSRLCTLRGFGNGGIVGGDIFVEGLLLALRRGVGVRSQVDYRRPDALGDTVEVEGWLESFERTCFWCGFGVRREFDGALVVSARQMLWRWCGCLPPVAHVTALSELKRGRKTSHLIWCVFLQVVGMERSEMAKTYAIGSRVKGIAYLDHDFLGPRLREWMGALMALKGREVREIMFSPDDLKRRSSMILSVALARTERVFHQAVESYTVEKWILLRWRFWPKGNGCQTRYRI